MKFSFPLLQWAQQEELIQSKFLLTFLVVRYLNTFANLTSLCDMPWSHWKWVAGWKFHHLLFPVLHHAQHITLHPGRVSLPQCSGVTPIICHSGEKVHMQSWIPRRLVKLGALFMLQIGRTKINGMFCKALLSKKRSSFSIYCVFSLLFCHYICLLHNFSVSKNMVSFPDVYTLHFLWVADFSLFNCGWDWSFAWRFPYLPLCRSHSNC